MKRRIMMIVCAMVLVLGMAATSFAANATSGSLVVKGPATAEVGDTVTYTVELKDAVDVYGLEFVFAVPDGLTVVDKGVSAGFDSTTGMTNTKVTDAMKLMTMGALSPYSGSVDVAYVTCEVAAAFEGEVTVTDALLVDEDGLEVAPRIAGVNVTATEEQGGDDPVEPEEPDTPVVPEDPATDPNGGNNGGNDADDNAATAPNADKNDGPKTGDNFSVALFGMVALAAAAAAGTVFVRRRNN